MRAIVTHFDGDPYLLSYWLSLYSKYWADEVDRVYMTICHNDQVLNDETTQFTKAIVAKYPKVQAHYMKSTMSPEQGNQYLLQYVTEDHIGLIESDGFIFEKGLVDRMFKHLEQGFDVVCPEWKLITDSWFMKSYDYQGFMRCFFFVKKAILDKTDLDFTPHSVLPTHLIPNTDKEFGTSFDLDCFGWLSVQIMTQKPAIKIVPANVLTPDNILNPETFSEYKWCHVRQLSSSALGFGTNEFQTWKNDQDSLIS